MTTGIIGFMSHVRIAECPTTLVMIDVLRMVMSMRMNIALYWFFFHRFFVILFLRTTLFVMSWSYSRFESCYFARFWLVICVFYRVTCMGSLVYFSVCILIFCISFCGNCIKIIFWVWICLKGIRKYL